MKFVHYVGFFAPNGINDVPVFSHTIHAYFKQYS